MGISLGYEEYYDYIFQEESQGTKNLEKVMNAARQWKLLQDQGSSLL